MGMYVSRAVTLLVLISDDVINRILKLDIQTNILVYVTRCCTDLTSKVLKERTFCQSSALLSINVYILEEIGWQMTYNYCDHKPKSTSSCYFGDQDKPLSLFHHSMLF